MVESRINIQKIMSMKNQLKQFTANEIYLYSNELNILNLKLKGIVSPLGLLSWLDNFPPNDYEIAIKIALNLQVFTTFEIEEILESLFLSLLEDKKFSECHNFLISPISKVDIVKSSDVMGYSIVKILKQSDKIKNKINFVNYTNENDAVLYDKGSNYLNSDILQNVKTQEKHQVFYLKDQATLSRLITHDHTTVILVDDFIGSGNTIETYINSLTLKPKDLNKINVIAVAGMRDGVDKLNQLCQVFIPEYNIYDKFITDNKYLETRDKELIIKFVKNYSPTVKIKDPLGYKDSETLVSFSYGSPNNTLKLIWDEQSKNVNNDTFSPLIPRFLTSKKEISKKRRKEVCFELAKYYIIQRNIELSHDKICQSEYVKYFIVKSKIENKDDFYICRLLGLFQSDYAELIESDLNEYINSDWTLTIGGRSYYNEIQQALSIASKNCNKALPREPNFSVGYYPNSFKGQSKQ